MGEKAWVRGVGIEQKIFDQKDFLVKIFDISLELEFDFLFTIIRPY